MDQSTSSAHPVGGSATRSRHKDRSLTEIVKEEPIACVAIAAAAGFMLGGGARRPGGLAILTLLGRLVIGEAFGNSASLDDFIGKIQERTV